MRGSPLRRAAAALGAVALVCTACGGETAPPAIEEAPTATETEPPTTDQAQATTTDKAQITTPPDGRPDHTYKAIAVGEYHSCAIATDDTIACWGLVAPPPGVRAALPIPLSWSWVRMLPTPPWPRVGQPTPGRPMARGRARRRMTQLLPS